MRASVLIFQMEFGVKLKKVFISLASVASLKRISPDDTAMDLQIKCEPKNGNTLKKNLMNKHILEIGSSNHHTIIQVTKITKY